MLNIMCMMHSVAAAVVMWKFQNGVHHSVVPVLACLAAARLGIVLIANHLGLPACYGMCSHVVHL
jgi:hypothetical protein